VGAKAIANRHVALLRGINVGGKHRVPMATLRELFVDAGASEVETYIQSGNVVYTAPAKLARALPETVRAALGETFGFDVPIVPRNAAQLREVAEAHPFVDRVSDEKLLMVAFLDRTPSQAKLAALDPNRSPGDLLEVRGQHVYLAFPNGSGRSKLDANWLDRSLDAIGTWRNWRTVRAVLEMM
jgi:uncharacterized protein (DUF1697 family)